MTHNFLFSWPYHTVLSSRPHLAHLLLLGQGYFIGGSCRPPGVLSDCKLGLTLDSHWLQLTPTLTWLLHVSFYNAHDFQSTMWLLPLIYSGLSCSEISLIDGLVKGQYATHHTTFQSIWTTFRNPALLLTNSKHKY